MQSSEHWTPLSSARPVSTTVSLPEGSEQKTLLAELRLLSLGCSSMRIAIPWRIPSRLARLGIVAVPVLVFSAFTLLKATNGGRETPAKELITGSSPTAVPVRKPQSNDQMAACLSPASTQLTS